MCFCIVLTALQEGKPKPNPGSCSGIANNVCSPGSASQPRPSDASAALHAEVLGGYMKCLQDLGSPKHPIFSDLNPEECCPTHLCYISARPVTSHARVDCSGSARAWQQKQNCCCQVELSYQPAWEMKAFFFSPRSALHDSFFFFFFSVKVLAKVRYCRCFFHVCVPSWWGSGQGSDLLAHRVERFPKESKIKGC